MNQEIKSKWISALISGEYVQAKTVLRNRESEYCCLGVLCDVYLKETGRGRWGNAGFDSGDGYINTYLPRDVKKWAELEYQNPEFKPDNVDYKQSLGALNDDGVPFQEIAEIIQKHF